MPDRTYPAVPEADLAVEPLARAETIPSAWYTDPAFHALDRDAIFARTWQYVTHVSRVAAAGEHVIASVADNPVVVVRGKDGVLRAFFNVCRHRGGPLAVEDGCAKALQCKYHGWTYWLDGTLRGVPAFDRTELFDKKDFGLIPLRVAEWEGLVFVNLDADAPPLETVVAGIAERLGPIDLKPLRFFQRVDYEVACNWKVYVDNYMEAYHVPHVHPELCSLYDFQNYRTEAHGHYTVQYSPIATKDTGYGAGGDGIAWYFCLFPAFMLNILPGRLQTNLVIPKGPDRCTVRFEYYYADAVSPEGRARAEADVRFSDMVQAEDIGICEQVQRGLGSRAYDRGRFSVDFEEGVYMFQVMLKEAYRRVLSGPPAAAAPPPSLAPERRR
jgi:choline monooxygenase